MIRTRIGVVLEITSACPGLVELRVDVEGRAQKAVAYPDLTGVVGPGDRVLLNTTAVSLGLGSGGYHFVAHVFGQEDREAPGPGHIMKLRYTPWQIKCQCIEEPGAPGHELLEAGGRLDGMPVVAGELHSQLAPVVSMARHSARATPKVAYIMTDGAALPIQFSNTVRAMRAEGLIDVTITCGHAFGGDAETVNVYSALLAARRVFKADLAVVLMGPGIVGTGTRYGFSGVEQAMTLDAAEMLGGVPIAALRLGFADSRSRHRGVSHHTLTVLSEMTHCRALVPVPAIEEGQTVEVRAQLAACGIEQKHRVVEVDAAATGEVMASSGLKPTTMGRGFDDEPGFFMAAGAAGVAAARILNGEWHS